VAAELVHGKRVGALVAGAPRHQPVAQPGPPEDHRKRREHGELEQIDRGGRQVGEMDERPWDQQGQHGGPGDRNERIAAGAAGHHAEDLAGCLRFGGADRFRNAGAVGVRDHARLSSALCASASDE
jgi:hypothetical protein